MKLFDNAAADFSKLIEMNPRGIEGFYGRANTNYLRGRFDDAVADINSVIERSPGDYKAYNTRGNILKAQKRYRDAVGSLTSGIDLLLREARSTNHPCLEAVERLLRGDLSQHQVALAFGNRQTLATIFGNRADAFRNMIEQDPKNKESMFNDLTRAILLHPENWTYAMARAQQHYNDKAYDRALVDFEQVLRVEPNHVDAMWGRAMAAHELRKWDVMWKSVETLQRAGAKIDEATLKKWREESGQSAPK
jgi:tetratricopeptide (TPR) repeat protein